MEDEGMTEDLRIGRRGFLGGGLTAVAAASVGGASEALAQQPAKPLPAYVGWKDPNAMIIHSDQTLEMKRDLFGSSLITPEDRLFVRNNVKAPPDSIAADRDGWRVEFAGVKQPKTLTVGELKRMGVVTVATVLQCSGNGRKYFMDKLTGDQKMSGTPWTVGASGCVIWSGVPLKTVIDSLGGQVAGVKYITGTGGEEIPAGLNPRDLIVERSVPLSNLDTVILAWEMNGKPISVAHGGPLRMIVPGYSGVNNVKYVKTVALTANQTDARIQSANYRYHSITEKPSPDQPAVWEQPVKSWITAPLANQKTGQVQITGLALGGMNALAGVDVSMDGGKTWKKAKFVGPDLGRFAWRLFVLPASLQPGDYTLVSRARDAKGNVQPEDSPLNGSGYGYNGWRGPAVKITVA
jgi:sulfite oxidase